MTRKTKYILGYSILFSVMLVVFQNCGEENLNSTNSDSVSKDFSSDIQIANSLSGDCNFYGRVVPNGTSIIAHLDAFVPIGSVCQAQNRTCNNGVLSGGYAYRNCYIVKSVPAVNQTPFNRSDVLLSVRLIKHYKYQPWLSTFDAFSANRIVWTYAGRELLQDENITGKTSVQCAFEYWVPKDIPQEEQDAMSCPKKDAAGNFIGYTVHPTYNLRIPDTNTTAWRKYIYSKAKNLVFLGCGSFVQDVPAIMAISRNTRTFIGDGCHSTESEAKYVTYKATHPTGTYESFMKNSVAEYHKWLHKNLQNYATAINPNAKLYFSANTSAASPAHIEEDKWFFPYFDYIAAEVFGDFSNNDTVQTVKELTRYLALMGNTANHPTVLSIRSNTVDPIKNIEFLRRSTISTYAMGMLPMIPWTTIALSDDPLNYFFGKPEDFADIYDFVRSKKLLFDNFPAPSVTELIRPGQKMNSTGTIQTSNTSVVVTSRNHVSNSKFKSVHIVNWSPTPQSIILKLKKSEYLNRPNRIWQLGSSGPQVISATDGGTHYVYTINNISEWTVLYYN